MIMDKFVVKTPSASLKAKTRSHLSVNITVNNRTRKYPPGTFHVEDGMLFCSSCNMVIDHVRKVCGGQALGSTKNSFEPYNSVVTLFN